MLLFKKFKLTLDPCKIGLLRATFYIQFIVLFEPFNLMYRLLKSDFKERYKLGRFFVITLYKNTTKSKCGGETPVIMLISTALLLDSIIRNSVCTPAKLPCRWVVEGKHHDTRTSL
jgi:hypothetical protein